MKVIYIAGCSRSGSTLVDRVLGGVAGVISLGEVRDLFHRQSASRFCGCGASLLDCDFWSSVLSSTQERTGLDLSEMMEAGRSEGRHRHVSRAAKYLRASREAGAEGGARGPSPYARYGKILASLYESVVDHCGASVVIDSSKEAIEALLAGSVPGVDMRVVHLVRDPRAVAHSWAQPKANTRAGRTMEIVGPARAAQFWMRSNLEDELFLRRTFRDNYRLVRYEDLVADPRAVLRDLAGWAGIDADQLPFVGPREVALSPAHTAGGNPDRFDAGAVEVRSDQRWVRSMKSGDSVVATLLCLPLLPRYRYPVLPWRTGAPTKDSVASP